MASFGIYSTDKFAAHYGGDRLYTERNWFKNQVWAEINDPVSTTVVNTKLPLRKNNIPDRARQADTYLAADQGGSYRGMDCAIVLDYYGNDSSYVGFTPNIGSAGNTGGKVAYVDFDSPALFGADDLAKPQRRYIGHEVGHVFGCYHNDGAVFGTNNVSYMWNGGNGRCFDRGAANSTSRQYSSCGENQVNLKANRI